MKTLVTGAAGFLGSHVVDLLLAKGHKVVGVDDLSGGFKENVNPKSTFHSASIDNYDAVLAACEGVELVYHLAADAREGLSIFRPVDNARINYMGSATLLRAALNQGVKRMVFTSSMARYGTQPRLPFTEDMVPAPQDPYAVSKLAFENLLKIAHDVFGLEYTVFVPHNIYGPRQNLSDPYRNVIAIFFNRIMRGQPPLVYGDGSQVREFTYIDDCAPYIIAAGFQDNCRGETINIGPDSNPVTVKHLAETIVKITGFKGAIQHAEDRPGEVRTAWCSADKARRLLGFKSTVPLDEGLARMWRWARTKGPQEWNYAFESEIRSDLFPKVWRDRLM